MVSKVNEPFWVPKLVLVTLVNGILKLIPSSEVKRNTVLEL